MEHDVIDDLERRLRAARPGAARVEPDAFDPDLLARVRQEPIAARRHVPRAVALPVAAGVTVTATVVVMLAGGPGDVGGPPSAAALTQAALRWLDPPANTILHVRSVETSDSHSTVRELWQSADTPASQRMRVEGARTYETSGDATYDPATNTIYDPPVGPAAKRPVVKPPAAEKPGRGGAANGPLKPGDPALPAADPIVEKVRILLRAGHMEVTGRGLHDGVDAWAISLKRNAGRPVWTLWVSAADGKPLELRDPGRDANEAPSVVRWPTYEVLPESGGAASLLTLQGAHPSARVVRDAAQVAAADQRLGRAH